MKYLIILILLLFSLNSYSQVSIEEQLKGQTIDLPKKNNFKPHLKTIDPQSILKAEDYLTTSISYLQKNFEVNTLNNTVKMFGNTYIFYTRNGSIYRYDLNLNNLKNKWEISSILDRKAPESRSLVRSFSSLGSNSSLSISYYFQSVNLF